MRVDQVAILDWSAAKGAKRGKDSIWLGLADASGTRAENIPTRQAAATRLEALIASAIEEGHRLLIGADFAFGFPLGFAEVLTGARSALAVWDWLSDRVCETAGNVSNYRNVAAEMNARFEGLGPFWGNGARLDVPGLPRLKPGLPSSLRLHRHCDLVARESGAHPKTVWQLAGAGAVGAQVLTGLPVLNALRKGRGQAVAVWPMQTHQAPVILAEVYPSLLHAKVREAAASGRVVDEVQVCLLADSLFRHSETGSLAHLMKTTHDPAILAEEGWLLGAGQSAFLASALEFRL